MREMILSVPHHPCPPYNPGHQCDLSALASARDLREALEERGAKVHIFVATVHRVAEQGGSDQNRPVGRGTKFRKDVEQALERSGTGLVDVHSFPEGYDVFGDFDVVIMDPEGADPELRDLARWLGTKTGLRTKAILGSVVNDIVVRARLAGRRAFLLEMNEGLRDKDRRRAMKALAEWLTRERKPREF